MKPKFRCIHCGEYHEGDCDLISKVAFEVDCLLDELDAHLGYPPEPGSRRWMIARGEYPEPKEAK